MNLSYQGEANVISTCCFLHFTRVMREILHMTHLCGKIVFVKAVICLDKSPFEIQQILYYRESKRKKICRGRGSFILLVQKIISSHRLLTLDGLYPSIHLFHQLPHCGHSCHRLHLCKLWRASFL